jgi:hypothetical protein
MICNFEKEQVTQEQINEARRQGEREGIIRALNRLTDDRKKELRRRQYLNYTRRNEVSAPPPQPDTPLPSAEKVAPPPPPPFLQVPIEKEDPPIILNTMYLDRPRDKYPPFYNSLGMNGLRLNNCMLDSGASANVVSLKVMQKLGLKTTRPYGNVCGIDSKRVKVLGVCEDVEVFLIEFPHISILMDIVVIDVPDAWGMLLAKSWFVALGGFLIMDLTHAHILMGDGTFQILYNQEKDDRHVMDPYGPDYVTECDYDVHTQFIEYDPSELPFMQEDSIDVLLPWTNKYKEKLAKYHGKDPGSIQILKKEDEKHEEKVEETVRAKPPCFDYTPCIDFVEGSLVLMWEKRKGKPRYDQQDNKSWLGPYITKKKSNKERYYLAALDGRKMSLSVDGSLLQPYIQVT